MNCRMCGEGTRVIDTATEEACVIRRRRCTRCGFTFITIEIESFDKGDATKLYKHRKSAAKKAAAEKAKG